MIHLDVTTIERDELLLAAIAGLELRRANIQQRIDAVRADLGVASKWPTTRSAPVDKPKRGRPPKSAETGKRNVTPAGRARIAAAQKKRWAAFRKAQGKEL